MMLSVVIITFNEEANIGRTLTSVQPLVADGKGEIIVVDSGSTDRTVEIAKSFGAKIFVEEWKGYAAQKNSAIDKATGDWILSLDADEELDEAAQQAVRKWKSSVPAAAGYQFARRAYYLGRWILHSGWYPDFKVRLFDRRKGEWKGAYVHESVEVVGPVETLAGDILHYTCDSLAEHAQRIEFYTDLAAKEMAERGESVGAFRRYSALPGFL